MRHAVIMAGGSGTRLWPLSRRLRPKQLMRLFDGASLLQLSRRRLENLFPRENIWVIASAQYLDQIAAELPDLPRENIIGEPVGRDTLNAIGLAAFLLRQRDPDGTMAVFTADHLISPQDSFAAAIDAGLKAAETYAEHLVTFGIKPDSPHTGYGYVHRGQPVAPGTYRVREFKEKPLREIAEHYLKSGEYYWNSGMFAWRIETILRELSKHMADNHRLLGESAADWTRIAGTEEALKRFESLQKISIDYGVMEKAENVMVVEMNCAWKDLGSWEAVASTRPHDRLNNIIAAPCALPVGGKSNILVSEDEHLIVTLGLSDVVVIHSPDATLVCHRDYLQHIRDLTELRKKHFGERFE